jgi:hypothetical protein
MGGVLQNHSMRGGYGEHCGQSTFNTNIMAMQEVGFEPRSKPRRPTQASRFRILRQKTTANDELHVLAAFPSERESGTERRDSSRDSLDVDGTTEVRTGIRIRDVNL